MTMVDLCTCVCVVCWGWHKINFQKRTADLRSTCINQSFLKQNLLVLQSIYCTYLGLLYSRCFSTLLSQDWVLLEQFDSKSTSILLVLAKVVFVLGLLKPTSCWSLCPLSWDFFLRLIDEDGDLLLERLASLLLLRIPRLESSMLGEESPA